MLLGGLALAYVASAWLCFHLAAPGTNATAVWIPAGLAIAAVLRFGPRVWPAIALGAFIANLLQMAPMGLSPAAWLGASLATAAGNTAEALLAGAFMEHGAGTREPFESGSRVLTFIGAVALGSTALGACVGTSAFCSATGQWQNFPTVALTWWIGDGMGALVITPLLLTFSRQRLAALPRRAHLEALLAGTLLALLWFKICAHPPDRSFILLPLLVLAAVRVGPFYTAALMGLLTAMATGSALAGAGPFSLEGPAPFALLMQQGLLGTLAMTALALAATVQHRQEAEEGLRQRNRLYLTLLDVNHALIRGADRAGLVEATCRILVEQAGFRMAWAGFKNEATGQVTAEGAAGLVQGYLESIRIRWDDSPEGRGPTGMALRENRPVICQSCLSNPDFLPWREAALELGYQTSGAFPIRRGPAAIGALMVYHADPQAIGPEEAQLLEELTADLGRAIEALETRQELRESERRLQDTFANVELIGVTLDAGTVITGCNDHLLRLTGWAREDILGRNWFDLFLPPELRTQVEPVFTAGFQSGTIPQQFENEILTRSGERRHIRWFNTLLRDAAGRVTGTISFGDDLTEHRNTLEALRNRATELAALNALGTALNTPMDLAARMQAAVDQAIAAATPDLALLFLWEEDQLRLAASAHRAGGARPAPTPDCAVGGRLGALAVQEGHALYVPDIQSDPRCTSWSERGDAEGTALAALPLKAGGDTIGVLALASTTRRDFQQGTVFLETLADQVAVGLHNALLHAQLHARADELEQRVAERTALLREANEDLALAVEHAEAADRAKSAFLAAMSHELRTPLNSVIGFTGVLLGGLLGELSPQQIEPLRIVQRNGRHLLDLINDVLDLSKIEAGEIRFSRQPFDLVQALREALESVAPLAAQKALALEAQFAVASLDWTGDRRRVSQVLLNLLGNAVKFTEQGTVTLELALEDHRARIVVRDTGPGIAEADLPRLFREFVQLDSGLARRSEGTGLGLALSRRLARLMDGNITVESRLGQGSAFTFSLPLPAPEPVP